jgi:tungstate transport system ATP-binding protein
MKIEILRLEGIRKQYGTSTVLDIATLRVEKGSVHALVGPNGSGKTTLLEIAALIGEPSRGSVYVLGEDGTADKTTRRKLRREVTLVDQNPYLFDTTVYRNIAFGLKARGLGRAEIRSRVGEALESVGLGPFAARRASGLSAGETQRVALARAMALRPALLLLDEPTANVDVFHVQILENLIRVAVEENDATVIFATHSFAQSQRLAGTTHLLVEGRLSTAPPEDHFFGVTEDETLLERRRDPAR